MNVHLRSFFIAHAAGVGKRELEALRAEEKLVLPEKPEGLGLIGMTGIGKTWALVQHFGRQIDRHVNSMPEHLRPEARVPFNFGQWVNWPDMAEQLKQWAASGCHKEISDWIERASTVSRLYLDDLGQERIRGTDDYSAGIIRALLNSRYRANLPVFWSSNLSKSELDETYEAKTVSRIFEAWPPLLIKGKDQRLEHLKGA